jgi:hypothetical protein
MCSAHPACCTGATDARNVGVKRVVLPSSFTGGPRYMKALFQDAMATVRRLGKPDLFITFTCNPRWREIKDAILPHQQPNDRPDIISRVFKLKLEALLDDLVKGQVLGKPIGIMHVIEYQKVMHFALHDHNALHWLCQAHTVARTSVAAHETHQTLTAPTPS